MRESIDGASFAQAMIHAAASLNLQKQQINELLSLIHISEPTRRS